MCAADPAVTPPLVEKITGAFEKNISFDQRE
jgi:hypothetical protein